MQGFGSELSIAAVILALAKIFRDVYVEWKAKREVVRVVNSNSNPGKGSTSTNLTLHLLNDHSKQLVSLNSDMVEVKIDIAKINTKLEVPR